MFLSHKVAFQGNNLEVSSLFFSLFPSQNQLLLRSTAAHQFFLSFSSRIWGHHFRNIPLYNALSNSPGSLPHFFRFQAPEFLPLDPGVTLSPCVCHCVGCKWVGVWKRSFTRIYIYPTYICEMCIYSQVPALVL